MKPQLLTRMMPATEAVNDNILAFYGNGGFLVRDTGIGIHDLQVSVDANGPLKAHVEDLDIHTSMEEKIVIGDTILSLENHINNNKAHITDYDRFNWDSKETVLGSQTKANQVQSNLNQHVNNNIIHVTQLNKNSWDNKYTKEEVDNKLATIEMNMDWKESVATFSDIQNRYPDPYNGWTVNVLDTNITYRFDGVDWIPISANSIPLATLEIDGLMAKTDKIKLSTIQEGANLYIHPVDINTRHVSDKQISRWDGKANTSVVTEWANGLMISADKVKLDSVAEGATNYVHPQNHQAKMIISDEFNRFVTDDQILSWNAKASSNTATINLNGLMSSADKFKLDQIQNNANNYIHPEFHAATIIEENPSKRFVTDDQITQWTTKTVSSIENGLMSSLDKTKLDTIQTGANNYVHPTTHPATIIVQDTNNRLVTDAQISGWNSLTNVVTALSNGLMSKVDKVKLDSLSPHPANHPPSIITQDDSNKFVTAAQIAKWDNAFSKNNVVIGSEQLRGSFGTEVTHNLKNLNYTVAITYTSEPLDIGDVWITKNQNSFILFNNGTDTTTRFDYVIISK